MTFNPLFLKIKIIEMDEIVKSPTLMATARKLSLGQGSGMNVALSHYSLLIDQRSIDAVGIFAYYLDEPVGWALFTYEADNFCFTPLAGKKQACGQIYVRCDYRRHGIGKKLMTMAAKMAAPDKLEVYRWSAYEFFNPFIKQFQHVTEILN